MRRVENQASQRSTSSRVFGMRFLTEEELKYAVVGCLSAQTEPSRDNPAPAPTAPREADGSFTIRLCGDGGDTDFAVADDAIF